MTDYISAELAATCAALGYYDGTKYQLDTHCLSVLKDLIKYLKRDDDSYIIRRFLGQTKLLQTDLVKIFVDHFDNTELWDVLLRLMINLTTPAHVIFEDTIPTEKTMRNLYQTLISYLQAYKVALTDDRVWSAVSSHLGKLLKTDSLERGEENELAIDRILVFIRNVLQIPPDDNEKRADNDATVHDELLFALNSSGIIDILQYMSSNINEQQFFMPVLEIISIMLREQNASLLAIAGTQRNTAEKERDEANLLAVRQKEVQEKMEKMRKYAGSRHSRFGGTYVVQNMKAIGENQLICHKPFTKIESLEFGQEKRKVKRPKNKLAMADSRGERLSVLSVRLFLKQFCIEFLSGAYNSVMRHVKSCILAGGSLEPSEASCYFWALRFFMEFNRNYKFDVGYVSETVSTEVFHLVQRQMEQCYEMMITDKKRIPIWSRRLHFALKAYQELLHTLMAMDKSTDQGVRDSSKVIKSNVFYVPEYRETILSQLLSFDEVKMSRGYLVDLVTTVHIFTKMLEHFCKAGRRVVVQKVKKKRKLNRKPPQKEKVEPPSLDERWEDVGPELSAVMQDGVIPEVVPFDITLDTPIDEQKDDAMKRIQKLLRQKHLEQALGLFRAAREVWPENECFGRTGIPPEEEFLALREIFFADLGVPDDLLDQDAGPDENIERSLNYDEEDEEEEEEEKFIVEETDFKFTDFIQRFANVKVVKALALLLQDFQKNSAEVNHYIVKLLHRIAWECKMPAMIFQASIFRIFQRIFDSNHPEHKELQKFAVFIVRRFAEVAAKNRKSYMELLFWKTTHDAVAMVDGYDIDTGTKKTMKGVWTTEQEDELRTLFMEHQTNRYPQDLIDWILEQMIDQSRTRRAIIKKLKELCLIVNSKAVRSEVQRRLPKEWSENEISELTEAWEQLKEDEDPVDLIFNCLTIKRPKPKIKEKLLELGLAKDRKELRKKRARKSNHGKSSWETQSASNSDEAQDSEEEGAGSSVRSTQATSKPSKKRMTTATTKTKMRKQPTVVYTDAQLSGLLKDVIDRGMEEALEWLKESLQDALDDRDEESSEGIPLVPLTDNSSSAMDSPSFQKLLRAMNIAPPADEQETYWRIPSSMLASMIQKRCKIIEDALAGNFISEEPQGEPPANDSEKNSSSDDEDVLENVKKYFAPREPRPSTSAEHFEEINSENKTSGNAKQILNSEEVEKDDLQPADETSGKATSRKKTFVLSSDSEAEEANNEIDTEDKRVRSSDESETEKPSIKKRRLLDSDDDEGTELMIDKQINKTSIVISDDEIEMEENSETKEPNQSKSNELISSDDEKDISISRSVKTRRVLSDDDDD